MKPHLAYRVPATREAIEKAFGPKAGKLFVRNPTIAEYAAVARFPDAKVIVSGELRRTLKKLGIAGGVILVIANDLTVEARATAIEMHCDVISEHEFGWTDARYKASRQGN